MMKLTALLFLASVATLPAGATATTSLGARVAAQLGGDAPGDASAALPRFHAAEGTRLLKTVTWKQELNLDEMGSTRAGSDLIRENVGGWLSSSMTKVLVDEYLEVEDGRPQQVRRQIRNVSGHGKVNLSGGRGRVEERTLFASPMKGLTLRLTWVPDEQEYARMYDELDGDELLLKDVSGDVDFIYLLPAADVAVGDSWEVELDGIRDLLAPAGDLGTVPQDPGFFPRMMEVGIGGDLADVLGRRLAGTATATFEGEREIDGRRLGVIALAVNLHDRKDRTAAYRGGMQREERQEAATLKNAALSYTLDGSGELLWDLEAGHFDSFELTGRESYTAEVFKLRSEGAEVFETSQVVTFSGDLTLTYRQRTMQPSDDGDEAAESKDSKGGKPAKRGR